MSLLGKQGSVCLMDLSYATPGKEGGGEGRALPEEDMLSNPRKLVGKEKAGWGHGQAIG